MKGYVLVGFALLGAGWYELSGGAEFEPGPHSLGTVLAARGVSPEAVPSQVTRVATADAPKTPRAAPAGPVPKLDLTLARATPGAIPDARPAAPELRTAALEVRNDATPEPELPARDLREVSGAVVNLRNGPGTRFPVITRLARGAEVEVLTDPGEGWVRLRATESARIGWMSDDFLRAAAD